MYSYHTSCLTEGNHPPKYTRDLRYHWFGLITWWSSSLRICCPGGCHECNTSIGILLEEWWFFTKSLPGSLPIFTNLRLPVIFWTNLYQRLYQCFTNASRSILWPIFTNLLSPIVYQSLAWSLPIFTNERRGIPMYWRSTSSVRLHRFPWRTSW